MQSTSSKQMVCEEEILTVRSEVDLSRSPPCQDNLCKHIFRTNYRLSILKKANDPRLPPYQNNLSAYLQDKLSSFHIEESEQPNN
ncbi:hypothetical protein DPMN_122705 [Dreissena polymorpha]|uniref:Uncharacterized protein n=1 Tax=Dreissena polymorpha TaxID=45954 RepID=A0A9D4GW14_DREPO|nr:hypothetical protein DPMN_122705 [Dreissena polymorpha]